MFVELSKIADVSFGYKSLQNGFFYLNKATIDTYGVERKYLTPILKLRDMDTNAFHQSPSPTLWLFNCKEKRADLRGTGALKYIDAMAGRSAREKKQTGKSLTIREVLEAQGAGLWYAPKARPNRHHIWLRKAFDAVFAPFLFDTAALVDQRCNSVNPVSGIEWKELAAVLTSSVFAYSLEINGAASMGAGALEAPTTKLRSYPTLDITQLKPADRKKLVVLAEAVWTKEVPVDWSSSDGQPGAKLKALDQWLIAAAGRNVTIDRLYADIREVCQSRILVARDKVKKTKKKRTDNIGNVAELIVLAIKPKLQTRNFPDDFTQGVPLDISFNVDRRSLKQINIAHLLDSYDVEIVSFSGERIYTGTHSQPVAEAIVRALLWGRSAFSVSSDRKASEHAVTEFLKWAAQIEKDINVALTDSALGTGYEDALKREVYARLGVHPLSAEKVLPMQIIFAPQA